MHLKVVESEALVAPADVETSEHATELLRAWTVGGHKLIVQRQSGWEEPFIWGLFLVDVARQIARSMAEGDVHREREVLARIFEGVTAEVDRPVGRH